jgi:hypothetical protein
MLHRPRIVKVINSTSRIGEDKIFMLRYGRVENLVSVTSASKK